MTRQQVRELEAKQKTPAQIWLDRVLTILPVICGIFAILEYKLVPDNSPNSNPNTYLYFLIALVCVYALYVVFAIFKKSQGNKVVLENLRYKAQLYSALFLLLAGYDYLTLKTGILTQPFIPCMNYIMNIAIQDYAYLFECTLHTLRLLFLGYFIGVGLGLVTGIVCGYSEKVRYWINPLINF